MGVRLVKLGSRWAEQLTIQRDDDDVAYAWCEGVEGAIEWAGWGDAGGGHNSSDDNDRKYYKDMRP